VASNATANSDRLIIIVLDDLHFSGKTDQVKAIAREVVTRLGPEATLALVTTSGAFGVEPTEDRARLLEEIDAFIDKFTPGKRVGGRVIHQPHLGSVRSPTDLGWFFANMIQYKVLQDVAARIRADDGRRKAFIWISGGNDGAAGNAGGLADGWYKMSQAGALHSLRRSGVVTYGVATGDFGSKPLDEISAETGGFVLRSNQFDQDVSRLLADLDHYYLLGFAARTETAGEYRPLEVRVLRPGLTVRHRRGYVAGPAAVALKNRDRLAQLAEGVLPDTNLPLRLTALPVPPSGRQRSQMAIALEVLSERVPIVDADARLRDTLAYSVWAVDLRRKKATRHVARQVSLVLEDTAESARAAGPVRYQVHTRLELPPGRYQLRASATSERLRTGGSVFLETTMPEYRREALDLGGILIAYADGPRVARVGDPWPTTFPPLQPALDREFAPTDTLRVVCDLFAPPKASGRLTAALFDEDGRLVRTLVERDLSAQPSGVDVIVPLGDLRGRYVLRVEVAGAAAGVRREVAFSVR
jgi:VWFA-related protein